MVPDYYKIQFSSAFVLFIFWMLINIIGQFTSTSSPRKDSGEVAGSTPIQYQTFGDRIAYADRILLDGLFILSATVLFNSFMLGNHASADVFSLVCMFTAILSSISHMIGFRVVVKLLWVIFSLCAFAILIVSFSTPPPSYYISYNPIINPEPNQFNPAGFNPVFNPNTN
jgi:hypothetical protein